MSEQLEQHGITVIDGFAVSTEWPDGLPRVRDIELAQALGYKLPRDIRKLIRRLIAEKIVSDIKVCATVAQNTERGRGRGRPGIEYHLDEFQAHVVIAKSETPAANEALKRMVRVFIAVRHGQLGASNSEIAALRHELAVRDEALVVRDRALLARDDLHRREIQALQLQVARLSSGVIDSRQRAELSARVGAIARLEAGARRWQSERAATADIYREIGQLTGWGGKGQPWSQLPAGLAHTVFWTLRSREDSARRAWNQATGGDRQQLLFPSARHALSLLPGGGK